MIIFLLSILFIYLIIGEPIIRKKDQTKLIEDLRLSKPQARVNFYKRDILRNWSQACYLLIVVFIYNIPLARIGFRSINLHRYMVMPLYLQVMIFLLIVGYFGYIFLTPCVLVHFNFRIRKYAGKVFAKMKHIVPINAKENFWWVVHALTAAAEELIYRGFIFFFIPYVIPGVNIFIIILFSICLDAFRYIPRFTIVKFVLFSALNYALLYIIFDSLYIPILVNALHYLKVFFMPFYYVKDEDQKGAIGIVTD